MGERLGPERRRMARRRGERTVRCARHAYAATPGLRRPLAMILALTRVVYASLCYLSPTAEAMKTVPR